MLLADFHVHTRWSDGKLPMSDVIDLFGRSGHDVIAITDHVVNEDGFLGRTAQRLELSLNEKNFDLYLEEIEREGARALAEYDMLVIPGAELTHNTLRRKSSAHALVLGIDHFISAEGTVKEMLERARRESPVIVACHPHEQSDWFSNTFYLWEQRRELGSLIDLWEIACRWDLFPPVARARLPFIANSDFHDTPHLYAWKTLLHCVKNQQAVLNALLAVQGIGITRMQQLPGALATVAHIASQRLGAGFGG